jgi:hypothetical protein
LISIYKENVARLSRDVSLKKDYELRTGDHTVIDLPSHSSSDSKLSNEELITKDDMNFIEKKLDNMNKQVCDILACIPTHNMSCK